MATRNEAGRLPKSSTLQEIAEKVGSEVEQGGEAEQDRHCIERVPEHA